MRIFAGLPIPAEMIVKVSRVCHFLKETYKGLNVVKFENLHVTLHFFGELNKHTVDDLVQLMDDPSLQQKKIDISLSGFSQFPPRGNPRVIYIDIEKGKKEITAYYKRFINLMTKNGFDIQETKKFIPHITIARNKRVRLPGDYRSSIPITLDDSCTIDRCVLFQSTLTPGGAEYSSVKTTIFG
jgi:RNA 2',3'-cyclic 3'-phosphodiesterase